MKQLLQSWVSIQAEKRPDATALVMAGVRFTYGELEAFSNRLARALRSAGCRKNDRVGLLMPKCPATIAGMIGVLKAECIYVPMDASSPATRLASIIQVCENRCILVSGQSAGLAAEVLRCKPLAEHPLIGWMEPSLAPPEGLKTAFSSADLEEYPAQLPDCTTNSSDPAHILFTSGSTGTPKGVIITHSNVAHFIEWAVRYFGMNETDRNSGHSPLHFDLSTFDIYGTFASGGELHVVPPEVNLLPVKLRQFIRDSELTQWFSVPSALNYLAKFDAVGFGDFPALKRVLWCGEVLPTPVLMYWMKRLPHVSFTNLYGPTEATIASSYYTAPRCPEDANAPLPIGTGCHGEKLLVLNENLKAADPGEVGDLYIQGVGLSPGYYRDPEKTRAAFLPHPDNPSERIYRTGDLARVGEDGLVYFVGRADTQIKSRGYRIELGEIASALHAIGWLQDSAVVSVPSNGFEGTTICCAYVTLPDRPVNPITLRLELSKRLPAYMLPSRWLALEELPKNANGKIDRRKLQEQFIREAA